MKGSTFIVLLLGGLSLGACASTHGPFDPPKPVDQMTPAEWCDYARFFLTNPENSDETRRIVIDKMRAKGCTK